MPTPRPLPATMRYVAAREPGPPEVLAHRARVRVPAPRAGEVLIEVSYAGVNRPDCLQRAGSYPPPPDASPIIGLEVAGTVAACGEGVTSWQVGDRVCALTPGGGYAEYCTTPAVFCLPIPEGLTLLEAASLPENYFTVWNNVFDRGQLAARRERCWSTAARAASASPRSSSRNAIGATVITTVGSDDKAAFCRSLGADHAINYRTQDFVAEVARITGKRGVDLVLDMVGGDYIEKNLQMPRARRPARRSSRFLQRQPRRGRLAPHHDEAPDGHRARRCARARSRARRRSRSRSARRSGRCSRAAQLKPVVHRVFPLADAAAAHALMESTQHIGKIMLAVRP